MLVTDSGIVTLVRLLQPENASLPMLVTLSPKIYVVTCEPKMWLIFELYVYVFETTSLLLMVTLVRPVQSANAEPPMLVTELPMVTLVKPVQYSNAPLPMLVTDSGIVTLVRPVQPLNVSASMLVMVSGMVILVKPLQPANA